jgi:hypothetical protein
MRERERERENLERNIAHSLSPFLSLSLSLAFSVCGLKRRNRMTHTHTHTHARNISVGFSRHRQRERESGGDYTARCCRTHSLFSLPLSIGVMRERRRKEEEKHRKRPKTQFPWRNSHTYTFLETGRRRMQAKTTDHTTLSLTNSPTDSRLLLPPGGPFYFWWRWRRWRQFLPPFISPASPPAPLWT